MGVGIYIEKLKIAIRRRMAHAGIVDITKAFQGYGDVPLDPSKRPFWMCEYVHADINDRPDTDIRNKAETILFQYDLFVPAGKGTLTLSEKEDAIRAEFSPKSEKRFISGDGAMGEVTRITARDDINERYSRRTLLFYVRCYPS